MKRKRRPVEAGEFQDPLSNYDPKVFDDDLERSLCEDPVTVMTTTPFLAVPPEATVEAVMKRMVELNVACVMVVEDSRLLGVFSERDVLQVAVDYKAIRRARITQVMTPNPLVIHDTDPAGMAINQMAVGGFRHIPVVDVDHKVVGIVGPRRVIDYLWRFVRK